MAWLFKKITDLSSEDYNAIYGSLSCSRKTHIDNLKNQDDKYRSLLATDLIDVLLKDLGVTKAKLQTDPKGKPFLSDSDLFVSISHCKQGVACAVSDKEVGIDLEIIKPVKTALINYICTQKEQEYVFAYKKDIPEIVTDKQILTRFFEVWTSKEAYFKKYGTSDMLSVEVLHLQKQHFLQDNFLITLM